MNWYAVLEVPEDASTATVRDAYRRLAQAWHPDKNPGERAEATRRMAEINRAWRLLKNPETRRLIDAGIVLDADDDASADATPVRAGTILRTGHRVPTLHEVQSGCVRRFGHDGVGILYIEFRAGGLYAYHSVPIATYAAMRRARSPSRFAMFSIVTGPYSCKRVAA